MISRGGIIGRSRLTGILAALQKLARSLTIRQKARGSHFADILEHS